MIQEILDVSDRKFYTTKITAKKGKGLFLVNGKYKPTLTIENADALQRWRFINATGTPRGLMTLKLCKCKDEEDTGIDETPQLQDMYLIDVRC